MKILLADRTEETVKVYFEKSYLNKGLASKAVSLFLKKINEKYGLRSFGAFTFSNNID